jgi:mono/diheme cytochrome c family protein
MRSFTRCAVLLFVAALLAIAPSVLDRAEAQQQARELPEEVSAWMERDQVRRWAELLREGQELFAGGSCTRCHGDGGTGGRSGPDLTDTEWVQSDGDLAGIRETVMWGVRRRDFADPGRRFEMNPSGGMDLEWGQMDALAAYVWSLSNGTQLPER